MATFTAGVALNMRWIGPSTGTLYELVANKRAGTPLAAGTPFTIADADADAFQAAFGSAGSQVPLRKYWANFFTAPAATPIRGRIAGLARS
jgi:hypothetical protein